MATNNGTEKLPSKDTDRWNMGEKESVVNDRQPVIDSRQSNETDEGQGVNEERNLNRKSGGEERGGVREKYGRDLTIEVEVEGTARVSMMEVLKEVKKKCGEVIGCRVRGERTYEVTMKDEEGKTKLMDGLRVKGALVHARDIISTDMVVSFINLPVYMEDDKIVSRLNEWGVRQMSPIKRRMWPGTEIADGTRFLKVRFTEEVRSLPYSTKFETLRGTEYFRVIHDRQMRVCRLCIKPGHVFRDCPEFKCFRCKKTGHFARECEEGRETEPETDKEESKDTMEEEEAAGGENDEEDRELERRYQMDGDSEDGVMEEEEEERIGQAGGVETDEELAETEEERPRGTGQRCSENQGDDGETVPKQRSGEEWMEEERRGGSENETAVAQRPTAKRKAVGDRVGGDRNKGPRSGM